jgi:hypothetical protein
MTFNRNSQIEPASAMKQQYLWATSRTCSHFAGLEMLTGFEGCAVYPGMIVT